MISAALAAQLCADQYAGKTFDHTDAGAQGSGVYWSAAKIPGATVIILRGSETSEDWRRDFDALPHDPFDHGPLGTIHSGFFKGMPEVAGEVRQLPGPRIIIGHSLGAARAAILSGLLTIVGESPIQRFGFGEPHPGFPKLRAKLSSIPAEIYGTKKGLEFDPVTLVPPLPYVASADIKYLEFDAVGPNPTDLHHIATYIAALKG